MPMEPAFSPQLSGKALAQARLRGRRRRAHHIRRTVVALTVAAFIAVWLTIYVQFVAGKDPALSSSASTQSANTSSLSALTRSGSSGSSGSLGSSTSSSGSSTNSSGSSTSSISPSPSSVTTSQS
jgi:hypothetical protein